MTLKNGSTNVRCLFHPPVVARIKKNFARSPAKNTPLILLTYQNAERLCFGCSINQLKAARDALCMPPFAKPIKLLLSSLFVHVKVIRKSLY